MSEAGTSTANGSGKPPITIKKYANRRLYNTATSSYVTLDNLSQMVKEDIDFVVFDAKSGDDITRQVLTQIIVEEESKGQNLLPISFLRQLIGFYGDNMQFLLPSYLESAMKTFTGNQDKMRQYMQDAFGGLFPFGSFDQMSKQNITMIERAMKMFSPFPGAPGMPGAPGSESTPGPGEEAGVADLKRQLDALQQQIERLGKS